MANVYYNVTLSSAEAGSGPNYDVSYSNDCVTYLPATPATVTLESIGAQAYIQVPDTMQCIKLTNINSNCVNSVVSTITTSTTTTGAPTTTTTTLAGTTTTTTLAGTTTTTTTAAPTTTTTTISLITNGLVSWYGCDSLSGSNWLDKSGNGNNAQVSGSLLTSYNVEGYLFNSGNYVVWPETINQIPSGSWTLQYQGALRVQLVGVSTAYDLWCKEDYTNGWDTVVKTTIEPVNYNYIFRDDGGFDKNMPSDETQGFWLVTMSFDAATNQAKLYLNGTFEANGGGGDIADFNAASTKRLVFGYNSNGDALPFGTDANRVKELLLYNKVLSAGEVTTNYNYLNSYGCVPSGSTTTTTTTAAPLAVYSGCGFGNSVAAACNDAGIYSRTLYSNCNSGVFGVGCVVYSDAGGNNPLTGYPNVFINSASWDINSSTGVITAYSSVQC